MTQKIGYLSFRHAVAHRSWAQVSDTTRLPTTYPGLVNIAFTSTGFPWRVRLYQDPIEPGLWNVYSETNAFNDPTARSFHGRIWVPAGERPTLDTLLQAPEIDLDTLRGRMQVALLHQLPQFPVPQDALRGDMCSDPRLGHFLFSGTAQQVPIPPDVWNQMTAWPGMTHVADGQFIVLRHHTLLFSLPNTMHERMQGLHVAQAAAARNWKCFMDGILPVCPPPQT